MNLRLTSAVLAIFLSPTIAPGAERFGSIKPDRELFIIHPKVVDDARAKYPGPWSFGALVNELVGEDKAPVLVREWLNTWTSTQSVNGFLVPVRPGIVAKVIEPWQRRDGHDPKSKTPWVPKLGNAPFRLLAIVNRMDLCAAEAADVTGNARSQWKATGNVALFDALFDRATQATTAREKAPVKISTPTLMPLNLARFDPRLTEGLQQKLVHGSYGGIFTGQAEPPLSVGEGRFIFGAIDEKGRPLDGGWTVIFEYRLPGDPSPKPSENSPSNPMSLRHWATLWHMLSFDEPGSPAHLQNLEKVTQEFSRHGPNNAAPSLGQIRTSEAAFGPGREFRQFTLDQDLLKPSPLSQTPGPEFAKKDGPEVRALAQFLREGAPLIRTGIHIVPAAIQLSREAIPVLGGHAIIPAENPAFQWNPRQGVPGAVRRVFSLNTCNGCHAGETECSGLHVAPRLEGSQAMLSAFLRMDGTPLHAFDKASAQKVEFREMEERAEIFSALLERKDAKRLDELRTILRERIGRSH